MLVILVMFDVFHSKANVLLVSSVSLLVFVLKTSCFARSACFIRFPGTFLRDFSKEFLKRSLTETSQKPSRESSREYVLS